MKRLLKKILEMAGLARSAAGPLKVEEFQQRSAKEVFTLIHDRNYWNSAESVSGTGSEVGQAAALIEELPALFQRILQNTIRDFYRRSKVRNLWTTLFSALGGGEDEDDQEKIDRLRSPDADQAERPEDALAQRRTLEAIEDALATLPARQREAFLLRYWEGLDTAETAEAMGCSQGSVKTHCSRATQTLAAALKEKGHQL